MPKDLKVRVYPEHLPEKVIQFGEGNFLRAFADWMFHRMNIRGLFNGRVVVVQPIESGLISELNRQDGLYTLILRGIKDGQVLQERELITSISRGINPYTEWEKYIKCAENPEIEFVISNTTEAGIVFNPADRLEDKPPASFPGKLTLYLYHRFRHFSGDVQKGMVIIPCELIDRNGDNLKKTIFMLADCWQLPVEFKEWLEEANYFLNTLVDRVVTGYPRDEIKEISAELGYDDRLLTSGELFHLWVIEGPGELKERLPFLQAGLNVIWTEDMTPYRTRKVRILNGAHTASVPAAFLYGLDTVAEMVEHRILGKYTREIIFEEIVPSIDMDKEMLTGFADAVLERFKNPYIKHYLSSILLNSTSKYKARVLPSLLDIMRKSNRIPEKLSFSLAALIALYRGSVEGSVMKCRRGKEEFSIKDDLNVLQFFQNVWQGGDDSRDSLNVLVQKVLANMTIWGQDLNQVSGLTEKVAVHLYNILTLGVGTAINKTISSDSAGLSQEQQ